MKYSLKRVSACLLMLAVLTPVQHAQAQEPTLGEISYFAGNFAPRGWAFCDGQLLAISGNEALFSLFGTIYGGDGRTTFALPDMRGRIALHQGQGPGLSDFRIGQKVGTERTSISTSNLPAHSHDMKVSNDDATSTVPTNKALAGGTIYNSASPLIALHSASIGTTNGGGQSMNNIQPTAVAKCIVALQGIYPSRS